MSHVESCPKCGAQCKTQFDRDTGETRYKALQDEDAFKKIEMLKQQILKQSKEQGCSIISNNTHTSQGAHPVRPGN